ncbi:BON domain-containing protein [Nonomuraea sp. MTCD27]|uniref:BON domain-containing protein n=1 Tax=Nonomuraea sp. MTCD27 TaxID=1676747 RepID=UPI0035C196E6
MTSPAVSVSPDAPAVEAARDDILDRALWVNTEGVQVTVDQGVVTLSGWMERRTETSIAVRMTRRVNGVVDVIDKLAWKQDDSAWDAK